MTKPSSFGATGTLLYLVCCVLIGIAIFVISEKMENSVLSDQSSVVNIVSKAVLPVSLPSSAPSVSALGNQVMSALEGAKGDYAVAIKNQKTGETFYLNEHKKYDTGSLYKVWIMAEAFKQIEAGQLSLDDTMSEDIPTLNQLFEIDSDNAELTDGVITLTVKQALNQMITISHNYAALLLTQRVKISNVKTWIEQNGFNESEVGGSPQTTASDMLLFFDKLYQGKLANPENTQQMLSLLKAQQKNNKLPQSLPEGVVIAHKTGEIGYSSHDAGIVYTPKGDYIIVVLSETDLPAAAEDRIGDISKKVYNYFNQK